MQSKKNTINVNQMIQRCHKWRQKRKQLLDQARQTADEIERERLLQTAEHYGRVVNTEQLKINSNRDIKEKPISEEIICEPTDNIDFTETSDITQTSDDEDLSFSSVDVK